MTMLLPLPWFARGDLRQRTQQIASVFARHGLSWMSFQLGLGDLAGLDRAPRSPGATSPVRQKQAEHLRLALEELGGTFIKLGQAISTRPDIIPPEYAAELEKLQDSAPPVPLPDILQVVREELHQSPEDIFAQFDPEPTASASIGQVHSCRLRSGAEIVMKIQRPGIAEQIEQDLLILGGMAEWAQAHTGFAREYRLVSLVEEFAHTIHGELDYRAEGRNADRFRVNFINEPALTIPRVYWRYTTSRVLTMERVHGIKISDTAELDRAGINRTRVAENSVRMMVREAFEFGFFHADAHPGNFFVRPDAGIVLLDFGMVSQLTPQLQDTLLAMGLALVQRDALRMTEDLYALGVATDPALRPVLQRDIEHLLARFGSAALRDLAAAQMLNELLGIAFRRHLQLPSEVVMLFRVIIQSEGLGLVLDPNFVLLSYAGPFLLSIWQQRHSPEIMTAQLARGTLEAAQITLQLPRQLSHVLDQAERGTLQVNISPEGMRDIMQQMHRMVNRVALSVVLAGTIMGLGLITVAYHPAQWERPGGIIIIVTFLASLAFGGLLMWSIFRTGGE